MRLDVGKACPYDSKSSPCKKSSVNQLPHSGILHKAAVVEWRERQAVAKSELRLRVILRSLDLPCEWLPGFGCVRAENVVAQQGREHFRAAGRRARSALHPSAGLGSASNHHRLDMAAMWL